MRWWVLAAAAALVVVLAVLLLRPAPRPDVGLPADAGLAECDAPPPPPVLADASFAPVVVSTGPGVRLFLDGAPVTTLTAGTHSLEAHVDGLEPARLTLEVTPFRGVLLDARADGPAVTVLVLGARCASCALCATELDTGWRDARGTLDASAQALALGQWARAVEQLRGVAGAQRKSSRFLRQLAVVHALGGRDSLAREAVPDMAKQLVALDASEAARQREIAHARWNATSDRFTRLSQRFGPLAPGATGLAASRIASLSRAVAQATKNEDTLQLELSVEAATEVVRSLVHQLRELAPGDCAYQAKITAAF